LVTVVAFSPDGRNILTGSWDKTVRLWNAASGQPRGQPLRHEGKVFAVAFSPDGQSIVTASEDKTARLWDVDTGQRRGQPLRHEGRVFALAFSPDGRSIVTASEDKTARLWDVDTCQPRDQPLRHNWWVTAVAFSPGGRTILTGSEDDTARLWDASTGQPRGQPLRHGSRVTAVAFGLDGWTVLTGSRDAAARLWDVATGQPRGQPLRHESAVCAVAFSPDGHTVLTGSEDKTARLWDVDTCQPRGQPFHHEGPVRAVTFSPNGRIVLTGSDDNTARLWQAVQPAPDDINRLHAWVHVRTGKAFDAQGILRQLSQADWLQACKNLEAHGGDWEAITSARRWHFIEADEATYSKQWFAAQFHLRHLLAETATPAEPFPAAERVVELAELLHKSNPDSAAGSEILGSALFRAGDCPKAVQRLQASVEKQKDDPTVWTMLFLSMAHHQLGERAKARAMLQQAGAQIEKGQDDKGIPFSGQERIRNEKLRQEATDLLTAPR
jgi:WD40 repeat protein